jgi:hypothetical protein
VPGPQSFLPHKVDIDKDYEENQRGAWDRELGVCAYIFSFFIIFFVIQLYILYCTGCTLRHLQKFLQHNIVEFTPCVYNFKLSREDFTEAK